MPSKINWWKKLSTEASTLESARQWPSLFCCARPIPGQVHKGTEVPSPPRKQIGKLTTKSKTSAKPKPKGTYTHQSLEKYVSSNKMIILSDCATKAGTAFNAWHLRSKFSWSMQSRSNHNNLLDSKCPQKKVITKASMGHQYRLPDRRLWGSCSTALKLPACRTKKIAPKMQAKSDEKMAKSKFR